MAWNDPKPVTSGSGQTISGGPGQNAPMNTPGGVGGSHATDNDDSGKNNNSNVASASTQATENTTTSTTSVYN